MRIGFRKKPSKNKTNVLSHDNMLLSIAANASFKDENEGDATDSTAYDDDNVLPPTTQEHAKHSEIWIHLSRNFSR